MARPRKTPQPEQMTEVEAATLATPATPNSNTNTRRMKMPLSPEEVRDIYANRRTKGQYDTKLIEFIESGANGVSVKEEWPEFADRKVASLKQGFENSKSRKTAPAGSEVVDVIVDKENVYLINRVVAGITTEADELEELVEA